ncbi:hypothetical protein [Microcella flavibacter]|nr:hypothetical protein [Microcella flavibacter]
MSGTATAPVATTPATEYFAAESYSYVVPIDPMDELHCESCQ